MSATTINVANSAAFDHKHNQLLAALPHAEWQQWENLGDIVNLELGQVLYEPSATLKYVYFPITSLISLVYLTQEGATSEIAVVGNEGMLGVSLLMNGDATPHQAIVQSAGQAFRLKAQVIKNACSENASILQLLLRYAQALITQMAQTSVCNRYHLLDQQLCRRLLLSVDGVRSNELTMTQELLGSLLGVRRESITAAAAKLQATGLIRYVRGRIFVLDRKGLEKRCCECYSVVKREYERLFPTRVPALNNSNPITYVWSDKHAHTHTHDTPAYMHDEVDIPAVHVPAAHVIARRQPSTRTPLAQAG